MQNIIRFHNVSFAYDGEKQNILQDLDFQIEQGEFISIIGPSGCGKSTIFRLLTGLEETNKGSITIQDVTVSRGSRAVGYMPQSDLLLPWRSILENAAISLECQGMKKKKAQEKVIEYLEKFGLQGYENKYPKDLSGGMRQRVSFLRTFLTGNNILLLDEPFSALDAITKLSLQEWLYEQWMKWNKTIVFITHDVEEALFLSQRIFVVTEKPISTMQAFNVPLPKERCRQDINRPEILQLKETLLGMLQGKVKQ
ncbi:ABC transporter ATP-binding protein [Ectobacillus sp. sgz5001026]|uniref:ABC transporter ATP-binding protein n=1 Tax=Ectobacillus sp. sgz5001026 TaxID=3242473 RepID=UPI0036D3C44D